ncbi:flavin reductase family protein [Streptomyces sp. SID8352]|uniref:flavin reductase family protein n=1 Tax=Streptomyces sp. SID8352 TaxID=2690338 RepID=UPI00136814E2|nr:flavin reductase family protein [Streptomyces sp. SID8352]MYU22495.1 flavin reductase [Streptomyces sp. SID8352]
MSVMPLSGDSRHACAPAAEPEATAHEFKQLAGSFLTGVAVTTAHDDGDDYGCTVSSLASVSLDPPLLMVCLDQRSTTLRAIERTGRFAVSLLARDPQAARTALAFARPGQDAFEQVDMVRLPSGLAVSPAAVAQAELVVRERYEGGDHVIVLGTPVWVSVSDGDPLAYWRARFLP